MDNNPDPTISMDMFDSIDDSFLFNLSPPKKPQSPAKKPRVEFFFESTFQLNGYSYTKNSTSKDKRTAYYLCKKYRSASCKARMTRNSEGMCVLDDCHTCLQSGQVGKVVIGEIFDATQEIKLMVEASSMEDVGKPVS